MASYKKVSIALLSLIVFIDISESNPIFGNVLWAYRDNCKGFVCRTETPMKLFKAFVGLNYKEKTMVPKKPLELKYKDSPLKHAGPQTVASDAEKSRIVITTPSTISPTIFSTVKTDSPLTTPSKGSNSTNHSALSAITSSIITTSSATDAPSVAEETSSTTTASSAAIETTSSVTTASSTAKETFSATTAHSAAKETTSSATTASSAAKETSSAITAFSVAEETSSTTTASSAAKETSPSAIPTITPSAIITSTSQSEYSTVSSETDFSTQDIGENFKNIRE